MGDKSSTERMLDLECECREIRAAIAALNSRIDSFVPKKGEGLSEMNADFNYLTTRELEPPKKHRVKHTVKKKMMVRPGFKKLIKDL